MQVKNEKQDQKWPEVLIVGGDYLYSSLISELNMIPISVATVSEFKDIAEELALVLFTGGSDVDPRLYEGVHTDVSFINPARDRLEEVIFNHCLKCGIKITGICRGFQFLNVMCGGKMYQHVNSHAGTPHAVLYPATNEAAIVTSTHHQLVMPPKNAVSVAWSDPNLSDIYIGPDTRPIEGPEHEIESAIYPEYNTFGVQFHPEMMRKNMPGRMYYGQVLLDFVNQKIDSFIKLYGYKGDNHVKEEQRGKTRQAGRGII